VDDPKLIELCERMFAQANAVNPRRDATIPYFAMKADRNQEGLDGHYWLVAACDIFLGLSTYFPATMSSDPRVSALPAVPSTRARRS
jgi:hypothetical protein